MKLSLQPIWPLSWILLIAAGMVLLVWFTYQARVRHLRPGVRRWLLGLRLATVALLVLAMLRPTLRIRHVRKETRFLYIVADSSRSMRVADVPAGTGASTRRQILLRVLAEAKPQLEQLARQNIEVRFFDFAETLQPRKKLTDLTDGRETNPAAALKELLKKTEGERVLGVVLMGDCAPRVSAALNPRQMGGNPREAAVTAARGFAHRSIPVHTLPIGGTGWSGSAGDLAVVEVNVDPNPYEGKVVSVHATFRAVRARGVRLQGRILIEDNSRPGQSGKMVAAAKIKTAQPVDDRIVPAGHDELIKRELTFVPTRPGKYKVAVEISGLPGEQNRANNRLTRIIDVRSGGISVAYFDRLRTEQKFLRKVNASDKIQLDYFNLRTGGAAGESQVDPRLFQPGENAYDVYIIGDVPARLFGPQNLQRLRERIDDGAGLLMLGGYDSFSGGGWANTPIAAVLPVVLDPAGEAIRRLRPNDDRLQINRPLRMRPTFLGLQKIVMRIAPDGKHRELWAALEPLEGANRLKVKTSPKAGNAGENLVEVLATTDGPNAAAEPLLVYHEWAGGKNRPGEEQRRLARVMAFAADTTFQWYLGGHQQAHQRFWRQMILFLAQKEEGDQPVWVRIEQGGRRNFSPAESIPLRFGARNPEGKAVPGLTYDVELMGPLSPDGKKPSSRLVRSVSGGPADNTFELNREHKTLPPGEYWIRVTGYQRPAGKAVPGKKGTVYGRGWERFLVESTDLELEHPAADPQLLETIATQTGGTFIARPQEFTEFLQRLSIPPDEQSGTETISLWDTWPRLDEEGNTYIPGLLLLFVTLLSLEWFLRKRAGLV